MKEFKSKTRSKVIFKLTHDVLVENDPYEMKLYNKMWIQFYSTAWTPEKVTSTSNENELIIRTENTTVVLPNSMLEEIKTAMNWN